MAVLQEIHQQKLAEISGRHRKQLKDYEEMIHDMQKAIQVLATEKVASTKKIKGLEIRVKYLKKKLSSIEKEMDALVREQDQINETNKRFKKGELKPSTKKHSDAVTEKEIVLPQRTSLEEASRQQQPLSDAENEMMRLSSLKQNKNLIEENLKLQKRAQVLEKENSLLNREKELQLSLVILSNEYEPIKSSTIGHTNLDSEVHHLRYDLEIKEGKLNESTAEKKLLIPELGELDRQKQKMTMCVVLMKDQKFKKK